MIITNAILTAYCLCHHCSPASSHGLCADGRPPIEGLTIAASRGIPLHTHIIIDNHDYLVMDRLAKKYDGRFDIFFKNHKDALKFGKQIKTITIKVKE